MTKVVINRCFGGFGLSPEAEMAYLKRKGKTAYFYKQTKYRYRDGVEEYTRLDSPDRSMFMTTLLVDNGAITDKLSYKNGEYFYDGDIERDDPDLIAVVEELGDAADGDCANLAVVDVPDGVAWEIDNYDGNETIDEVHRSWR